MNRAFTGDLPGDRLTISGGARSRSALRRRGRSRWVVPTLFFRPLIHLAGLPQQALDSAFDVLLGRRAWLIDARAALGATDFRFGRLVVSMIKDVAFLRRRGVLNVDGRGLSRSGRDHGENQPCRHDHASPPRNGCALPARATQGRGRHRALHCGAGRAAGSAESKSSAACCNRRNQGKPAMALESVAARPTRLARSVASTAIFTVGYSESPIRDRKRTLAARRH
jgi:hypothetical protein